MFVLVCFVSGHDFSRADKRQFSVRVGFSRRHNAAPQLFNRIVVRTRVPHPSWRLLPRGACPELVEGWALGGEPSRGPGPILPPEGEKDGAPGQQVTVISKVPP